MFHIKVSLFARTKSLENKIDLFHDKIIDAAMTFKKAIRVFLNEKRSENYRKLSKQIKTIEHDADALRRDIENKLYIQNLIPDLRADVLHLVENLDKIINKFDEVTYKFYIEQPDIPAEYHSRVIELCEQVSDCAENMAIASRAFFRDFSTVRDYSQKVYFIEHESDLTSGRMLEAIFDSELPLANKLQLDSLITEVADIADIADTQTIHQDVLHLHMIDNLAVHFIQLQYIADIHQENILRRMSHLLDQVLVRLQRLIFPVYRNEELGFRSAYTIFSSS